MSRLCSKRLEMKYEPKYVAGKGEVFCNRNSQQEPAQPALKWLILHLKYEPKTTTLTVHPVYSGVVSMGSMGSTEPINF